MVLQIIGMAFGHGCHRWLAGHYSCVVIENKHDSQPLDVTHVEHNTTFVIAQIISLSVDVKDM